MPAKKSTNSGSKKKSEGTTRPDERLNLPETNDTAQDEPSGMSALKKAPEAKSKPRAAKGSRRNKAEDNAASVETVEDSNSKATGESKPKGKKRSGAKANDVSEEPFANIDVDSYEDDMIQATSTVLDRRAVLREKIDGERARNIHRSLRERMDAEWDMLSTAMNRKSIVHGIVSGVEELNLKGRPTIFVAIMMGSSLKVLIPFSELYMEYPIDLSTVNITTTEGYRSYVKRQRQMAEKLYNLDMDFCVTNMARGESNNPGDYLIIGSRKMALSILEHAHFFPRSNGTTLVNEGDFVDGMITSVSMHALALNIFGVDVRIPLRLVSFRYITDLQDYFVPGDTLRVKIKSIEKYKLDNEEHVRLLVSGLDNELEEAKDRQYLVPVGAHVLGVITSIRKSKKDPSKIVILAYLDNYELPVRVQSLTTSNFGYLPQSGDTIRIEIRGHADSGYVMGNFKGFVSVPRFSRK